MSARKSWQVLHAARFLVSQVDEPRDSRRARRLLDVGATLADAVGWVNILLPPLQPFPLLLHFPVAATN